MSILFISRGTLSGVRILVGQLRERTGVKCLSRRDLFEEVGRYGDWATTALSQLSRTNSAYDDFSLVRRLYTVLMRQALLREIRNDNVVYYGFSGHLLVPHLKHFVRVRINAPLGLRLSMTMKRMNCDEISAREYIRNSDDHQVRWARSVYGHDIRDPSLYDLNVSLGNLSTEVLCGVLECVLNENHFQASDETKARVEELFIAANVEGALLSDRRTREFEIEARLEHGCVFLSGPYLENGDRAIVEEIASKVDGVQRVEYNHGICFSASAGRVPGEPCAQMLM